MYPNFRLGIWDESVSYSIDMLSLCVVVGAILYRRTFMRIDKESFRREITLLILAAVYVIFLLCIELPTGGIFRVSNFFKVAIFVIVL
jgi:hypothetical protein